MANKMKLAVILGSTRQGRQGKKIADWAASELTKDPRWDVELIDLADYPMPFFDSETPPLMLGGKYADPIVTKWAAKVAAADAYVFVTPEYNHMIPAVLKNAMEQLYYEWAKKPAFIINYSMGPIAGSRAAMNLKQILQYLNVIVLNQTLGIGGVREFDGTPRAEELGKLATELAWWAELLTPARAKIASK